VTSGENMKTKYVSVHLRLPQRIAAELCAITRHLEGDLELADTDERGRYARAIRYAIRRCARQLAEKPGEGV